MILFASSKSNGERGVGERERNVVCRQVSPDRIGRRRKGYFDSVFGFDPESDYFHSKIALQKLGMVEGCSG